MNLFEKQEIEFKYETESRKSSLSESYSKVFERVKSPTFEFPSETQLQDGPYVDSTFNFHSDVVLKRPKVSWHPKNLIFMSWKRFRKDLMADEMLRMSQTEFGAQSVLMKML